MERCRTRSRKALLARLKRPLRRPAAPVRDPGHGLPNPDRPAMTAFRLDDMRQHSDLLQLRGGKSVTVRFVEPADSGALQSYFRALSTRSRYNRFLGAVSELPQTALDQFIHVGENDRFSVIATLTARRARASSIPSS